jgi:hypothetical protein
MDFQFVNKADQAAFALEKAKRGLEQAKLDLEAAKIAYEEVMAQAESHGLPRARLKKLVDERVQALLDGGLVDLGASAAARGAGASAGKPEKTPKKPRKAAAASQTNKTEPDGAEPDEPNAVADIWAPAGDEAEASAPSNA